MGESMTRTTIPLVDLRLQHEDIKRRRLGAVLRDQERSASVLGDEGSATSSRSSPGSVRTEGVATEVHYPRSLDQQPALEGRSWGVPNCPESRRASQEVLSLPMFSETTPEEQEHVVARVRAFFGGV